MTRSPRLIHLSHEHASALKLALAVRALTPEDPSALPAVAQRIRDTFERELSAHFEEEEKHVLPRLEAAGRTELAERTRRDHERLRELADALATPTVEGVRAFAAALTAHVAFEENIVWEALEPGAGMSFDPDAI
ncbi:MULTISPECIES: hemerythrin domain-containing protein [Niveibacterium]|uniref:Hemerythrin domain-containing protein n=1 Tax=Niveibacterium microcysteis TaxID=2811415 RepID=A0ABX7MD71_9RHOO|nr:MULTISPECIES: hemerythrin domain-containing protein [Niveibacterium]QSI77627.1 hemerythrin domain-containing protein [Niveibacterium microcysteis]